MNAWCTALILAKPEPTGYLLARRAQLEALGRSMNRHTVGVRKHLVTDPAGKDFARAIDGLLETALPFVMFACDDGLFVRDVGTLPGELLEHNPDVLTFSLRYGANTTRSYPSDTELPAWPGPVWEWWNAGGDFGYPGSVDAHVFRRDDLRRMLEPHAGVYTNPTYLEVCLDKACRDTMADCRPLMASYAASCYVGVPVNRVSAQSNVRAGATHPQPAAELNERFDAGERIDLDAIDGPHTEIRFEWTR
jgi:hypothetical protein